MNLFPELVMSAATIGQPPTEFLLGMIIGMVAYGLWCSVMLVRDMKKVEKLEQQVRKAAIDLRLHQERLDAGSEAVQKSEGSGM